MQFKENVHFSLNINYFEVKLLGKSTPSLFVCNSFLGTGGVSYALSISLLISKLFRRKGCMGGGWWGLPPPPPPPPIQLGEGGPLKEMGPETHVHKITNVPVFYMTIGLIDFAAANPLLGPLERGGGGWAENLDQVALASLVAISGPKKS
jgi:hypothetical protein